MLKKSGINSHKNLQINEGLLFCDINLTEFGENEQVKSELLGYLNSDSDCTEKFMGRTKNGVIFSAVPKTRMYNEDGGLYKLRGSEIICGWDVTLETTLIEFSPNILSRVTPEAYVDDQSDYIKRINTNSNIFNNEYKNLVWFGDLSGGELIVIELKNAVNLGGIRIDTSSENESSIKIRFNAQAGDYFNRNEPPYNIYFINNNK